MGMCMKSRKELTEELGGADRKSDRRGKGIVLDQFCGATHYHRAYAAMLLRGYRLRRLEAGPGGATRIHTAKLLRHGGGTPPRYGAEVQRVVVNLWRRFGYLCGKRLAPILRRCLASIRRDRFLHPSEEVCEALKHISAASIDRLLKPARQKLSLKGRCHTRAATGLLALIPYGALESSPRWLRGTGSWTPSATTEASLRATTRFPLRFAMCAQRGRSGVQCRTVPLARSPPR